MKTRREIKADLLDLYRHFFHGNTNAADGTEIRAAINRLEKMLTLDDRNR